MFIILNFVCIKCSNTKNILESNNASNENCEEKSLDLCVYHKVELDARDVKTAHRLGRSTKMIDLSWLKASKKF